jgi:hypothetical protein
VTEAAKKFCKTRSCPSTDILLAYSARKTGDVEAAIVSGHLFECEFCAAELELLTKHPPGEPNLTVLEIPLQLLQLAEILLKSRQPEFQLLQVFLHDNRFLTRAELPLPA